LRIKTTKRGLKLTSLCSLLVHDTVPAFPTADGLSRFDLIFGTAIFDTLKIKVIPSFQHASYQRINIPSPASEEVEMMRCYQRLVALVDS
jgi:hypothetical protein